MTMIEKLRTLLRETREAGREPERWEMTPATAVAAWEDIADAISCVPSTVVELLGLPVELFDVLRDPRGHAVPVRLISTEGR